MLAVLGGLADLERDLIRTAEGRNRAKLQGKHFVRPLSLNRPNKGRPPDGGAGRYVAGISGQLRPQHIHHAPRDARGMIEHRAAADSPTVYATRG